MNITVKRAMLGAAILGIGLAACASPASSDTGSPEGVRIQRYTDPTDGRVCLVFTHDTAQGASIAVDCTPRKP
jgi:hypothetical protein